MNVTQKFPTIYLETYMPSWDDVTRKVKKYTFALASYLTDPVCSFDADKIYLKEKVFTQLFPCNGSLESRVSNWVRKSVIATNMVANLLLTPFTAPAGIFLRYLGTHLSKEPFIYEKTNVTPKQFPSDGSFTLDNWNILLIPGENSILHGGAPQADSAFSACLNGQQPQGLPYLGLEWLFSWFVPEHKCTTRLNSIIAEINKSDADVVCLYEGFDFSAVEKIKTALKHKFHCMVSNIAPRAVGPNSGVVILSKFDIPVESLVVKPFPEDYKDHNGETIPLGLGGCCGKSLVKFSIVGKDSEDQQKTIADIYALHLLHSKSPDPSKVTENRKIVRASQLDLVFKEMNQKQSDTRAVIVCGDLNMDPNELKEHPVIKSTQGLSFKGRIGDMITWGGDTASAAIEGIDPSDPLQLDYVLASSDSVKSIETTTQNCGNFDSNLIKWDSCSDHYLLKTTVQLKK